MLAMIVSLSVFATAEDCRVLFPHRAPKSARAYFHAFDTVFNEVGAERKVDPALLKSIAWCETRLDPCATSPVGAQGLMQFMPSTFDSVSTAAAATDPFDPTHSIRSAGVYIAALVNYWQGNIEAVVASYNAGPGAVAKALRRGRAIPAIAETQGYVACVLGAYAQFRGAPAPKTSLLADVAALFSSSPGRSQ